MSEWTQSIMQQVREQIAEEADLIGADMVLDIQEALSTPVDRGPGGRVIGRSPAGDNPWLETGRLQESERYELENNGAVIDLIIINDAPYAEAVHNGHGASGGFGPAEPRPFHDLALERWESIIPDRIANAITAESVPV